jgi:hypothetical protein
MVASHPPRDRKDHYVPQGYLRGFVDPARSNNDRPLWCLNKWRNQWERKSPKEICHVIGMYDFANDAIEVEHADVTFKAMEDGFPSLRDDLKQRSFIGWREHLDFLCRYMQMMRVRSPYFFVEQGQELLNSYIGTVTSVDESERKISYDPKRSLSEDQVHDFTLTKMREEYTKGAAWMNDFHWQLRTTFDPYNPVIASESPLFVKGEVPMSDGAMTMDALKHEATIIYFPLCWQACLVGHLQPFDRDVEAFEQSNLLDVRHMISEMAPQYVIAPQIVAGLVLDGRSIPTVSQRSRR